MKNILFIFCLFATLATFGQQNKFVIEGSLGTYNAPAKVYLRYQVDKTTNIDSVKLKDGKFKFSGRVSGDPLYAILMFNPKGSGPNFKDYKEIYLENGVITITGTDSLSKAALTGTKTNEENIIYNTLLKTANRADDALEAKEKAATSEQRNSDILERENSQAQKAINTEKAALNKKFISENPDSYISLIALEMYAYYADYNSIAPLFDNLSASVKATEAGKKYAARLPILKSVAIGATAPEIIEADTNGKKVSLSSFRGKYVLLDFWASWCAPCRLDNPHVVKAFGKYKNQNFTILGVSLDRPGKKDNWLKAIHKDGLTWNHVSDLQFFDSKPAVLYAVRAIPQNFLIDPNGKIIARNLMGSDLEDKLAELFGKI